MGHCAGIINVRYIVTRHWMKVSAAGLLAGRWLAGGGGCWVCSAVGCSLESTAVGEGRFVGSTIMQRWKRRKNGADATAVIHLCPSADLAQPWRYSLPHPRWPIVIDRQEGCGLASRHPPRPAETSYRCRPNLITIHDLVQLAPRRI